MLILASTSPQRSRLLADAGLEFKVHHPNFEEIVDETLSPKENAKQFALGKAKSIKSEYPNDWVLGVDTLVVIKDEIIGKPKDREDAKRILNLLKGATHQVISGIALINGKEEMVESEITDITFGPMSDAEIEHFLDTNEWQNRSGAFTIERHGALYIQEINGDYYNVVGLPLFRMRMMLQSVGITFYPKPIS